MSFVAPPPLPPAVVVLLPEVGNNNRRKHSSSVFDRHASMDLACVHSSIDSPRADADVVDGEVMSRQEHKVHSAGQVAVLVVPVSFSTSKMEYAFADGSTSVIGRSNNVAMRSCRWTMAKIPPTPSSPPPPTR